MYKYRCCCKYIHSCDSNNQGQQHLLYIFIKNYFTFYKYKITQEISSHKISDRKKIEPPKYNFLKRKSKSHILMDLLVER